MRINNGMPVWHASISLRAHGRHVQLVSQATVIARYVAALALHGVGVDKGEWWLNNRLVAHLRVATTPEEQETTGEGLAEFDAGATGTWHKGRLHPDTLRKALS